jgi:hypothetical protein
MSLIAQIRERLQNHYATIEQKMAADKEVTRQELIVCEAWESRRAKLEEHERGLATFTAQINGISEADFCDSFAQQMMLGAERFPLLARQWAEAEVIKTHRKEILAAYQRLGVDAAKAELEAWEKEHKDVLRKHGLIP